MTPNAPEGSYALLVYCEKGRSEKVRMMLKSMDVNDVTWKSDRESLIEILDDPLICLQIEMLNPDRLEYLSKLTERKINPEVLNRIAKMKMLVNEASQNLNSLAQGLKRKDE